MGTDIRYKVMIIDDDENTVATMKSQISVLYDVITAFDGKEALKILKEFETKPNLILLDINMPGMDGYAVLEEIKNDEQIKYIPVVFLTGVTDENYELKGLQMDVVDYLKKPITGRVLLTRIQHYIDLHSNVSNKDVLDMDKLNGICEPLTDRELEVAKLMADFRSDREISEILHISVPYVKKLVCNVKDKLQIEKRGDIRQFFIN